MREGMGERVRAQPRIRVFVPPTEEPAEQPLPPRAFDHTACEAIERLGLDPEAVPGDVSPQMTLPEFFVVWFLPNIMRKRANAAATIAKSIDALRWWRRLTSQPVLRWDDDLQQANDPPLGWIVDTTLSDYQVGLREARWRRGKLGPWELLSQHTIAGHLVRIQEMLDRAGPTFDRRKPGKGLIEEPLAFSIQRPRCKADPPFTLDQARAIVAAAQEFPPPRERCGRMPVHLTAAACRTFYGLKFATGVRVSTMLLLRWEWLSERGSALWLSIPSESVLKTGKEDEFALPDWLASHLAHYRRASGLMLPSGLRQDRLDKMHRRVQQGIVQGPPMGFNAWRRTMVRELALLGAKAAREAGRAGLNHGDGQTTNDSYCDIDNLFRPLLPPLWFGPIGSHRQAMLFQ